MSFNDYVSAARETSVIVARDVFGINQLYQQQLDVLVRLFLIQSANSTYISGPVFFVKPTGGGKSLVRDIHGVVVRGITLTIVPLLSLGADQAQKLRTNAIQNCGDILTYHLDEIKNEFI